MIDYKSKISEILDKRQAQSYSEFLKIKFREYKFICVFGLGNVGKGTVDAFEEKGIEVDFFCDNDTLKVGNKYKGIECISVDELKEKKEDTLVIIATRYYKEIYEQLKGSNFKNLERIFTNKFCVDDYFLSNPDIDSIKMKILNLLDILDDEESKRVVIRIIEEWFTYEYKNGQLDDIYSINQYFCKDLIKLSNEEIFVDGGAYTGDTICDFLINCNNRFEKIYAFELNERTYKILNDNINNYQPEISKNIVTFSSGLSSKESEIYYNDRDEGSSIKIDNTGSNKGKTVNIDKALSGEKITFIKMDIEGSEMEALDGARNTIQEYKPKLAICLYHKPQDLWEIPLYIKKLIPEYKLFIRHHTDLLDETVCYAVLD